MLSTLERSDRAYMILDALDRCSQPKDVLKVLSEIHRAYSYANILVTSRKGYDIDLILKDIATSQICIQNALVDADTRLHVQSQLASDIKLKRWPAAAK